MFVRDEVFKHTGWLHQPETQIKRTGENLQLNQTVMRDGFWDTTLSFRAEMFEDGHWRVHISAGWCPSVHFTGVGDPIVEFVEFARKHREFFSLSREQQEIAGAPWQEVKG